MLQTEPVPVTGKCDAGAHPCIWKVTANNATVYLFGSIHVGAAEFYPLPAPVESAFSSSDELVVELFPRVRRTFLERMLEDLFVGDDEVAAALSLPPMLRAWAAIERFPKGEPLAIMPYRLEVR